jgi:putative transposase
VLSREGSKAFNDKILPYIKRDYDKIEVGDILIADGHILDFEIINPITGKPKRMMLVLFFDMKSSMPLGFEIMPTENTMAIASALRRSILVLGFTPRIVYLDNGRAFRGKYFTGVKNFETSGLQGLFARIGVNAVFAKPYHGQSKTIERFFGVLAQFERRLPSYVGNSVANKPARLMRNEKLHRRFFDGVYPTLQSMAANLVEFFREYSLREHQGGFYKGHTPAEIFNESLPRVKSLPDFEERIIEPRELDYLMMSEESRMVGRNGVRLFGKYYFNEALLSIKDKVTVRYDFTDLSRVLVFDVRNNFICEATDEINKLHHPMARLLGTEEEINELSNSLKIKGRIEKSAKREAAEVFEKINAEESLYKFDYQLPAASEKPKRIRKSDREKDVDEFFNQWNKANPF